MQIGFKPGLLAAHEDTRRALLHWDLYNHMDKQCRLYTGASVQYISPFRILADGIQILIPAMLY